MATLVHVFDYPYEASNEKLSEVLRGFGEVKSIKHQSYLANQDVFTGTRLVSMMFGSQPPPRSLLVDGFNCRVWYKGQPLICNLCGLQGHKSANCTNKDMCRRCGVSGHFARACPQAWGSSGASFARGSTSVSASADFPPLASVPPGSSRTSSTAPGNSGTAAVAPSQDSLGDCPDFVSLSPGALDSTPGNDESCAVPANPDPVIMDHSGISSDCAPAVHSSDVSGPVLINLEDADNVNCNVGTTIGPSVINSQCDDNAQAEKSPELVNLDHDNVVSDNVLASEGPALFDLPCSVNMDGDVVSFPSSSLDGNDSQSVLAPLSGTIDAICDHMGPSQGPFSSESLLSQTDFSSSVTSLNDAQILSFDSMDCSPNCDVALASPYEQHSVSGKSDALSSRRVSRSLADPIGPRPARKPGCHVLPAVVSARPAGSTIVDRLSSSQP